MLFYCLLIHVIAFLSQTVCCISVVTSVSLNFPAWPSAMLLYLLQVWYKNSSICSVLWVLWCLHRAPIKVEFSKWSSHGFWRLAEIFWGKTHRNSKPGLNMAKRRTDLHQQQTNLTLCTSFLRCCALWARQEQNQPYFYWYLLPKCGLSQRL